MSPEDQIKFIKEYRSVTSKAEETLKVLIQETLPNERKNEYDRLITEGIGQYLEGFARTHIPDAIQLYQYLVNKNHTEDNKFEYNDLDNHSWYIPHDTYEAFCVTSQNHQFLYVLSKAQATSDEVLDVLEKGEKDKEKLNALHEDLMNRLKNKRHMAVYNYFNPYLDGDQYDDRKPTDTFSLIEYLKCPSDHYSKFSDNLIVNGVLINEYVYRPDLKWFMDNDFGQRKGSNFFAPIMIINPSADKYPQRSRSNPMYNYRDFNMALWELYVTNCTVHGIDW